MKRQRSDPNRAAFRIVKRSTEERAAKPKKGLEAAWTEWSGRLQRVDERTMTLLRAAFEAGYSSGKRSN